MIEKIHWIESEAQTAYIVNEKALEHKINELVDAVNKQDKAIRLLINGLECFAKGQQLMNKEIEIKG